MVIIYYGWFANRPCNYLSAGANLCRVIFSQQSTPRRQTPSPWAAQPDIVPFYSSTLVDIVVEITGHSKVIRIIRTNNHDMLLRRRQTE